VSTPARVAEALKQGWLPQGALQQRLQVGAGAESMHAPRRAARSARSSVCLCGSRRGPSRRGRRLNATSLRRAANGPASPPAARTPPPPQVLVLDEADLLLSYGYEDDLRLLAPQVGRGVRPGSDRALTGA
jgi:hypothetical protein